MATACGTRLPSVIGASSTNQTPSANSLMTSAATCSESRVLPMPPIPVSVSSRVFLSAALICSCSRSRPMNVVTCCGRLFGTPSRDRSAGNDGRSPACCNWKTRSAPVRSAAARVARSRRAMPCGSRSLHQFGDGLRRQHLAAVGGIHDARCAIDHPAEIIAVAPLDHPGMDSAAHAKLEPGARVRDLPARSGTPRSPRAHRADPGTPRGCHPRWTSRRRHDGAGPRLSGYGRGSGAPAASAPGALPTAGCCARCR